MVKVNFYNLNSIEDSKLLFAVIMAKYKDKWVFVRHEKRNTWEIPGGHREENENINVTASRELVEETGAKNFKITPVCIYSVEAEEGESFGGLFCAEIDSFEELPDYEIEETKLLEKLPKNLTYPLIQPDLFYKVEEWLLKKLVEKETEIISYQ